jgi:integrase
MSIRKRTWQTSAGNERACWIVDYRDQQGKRRHKQFERKKQAEAFRDHTAAEVRQGLHVSDKETVTVAQAAELWLKACEAAGLERSTLAGYRIIVKIHIVPFIGDRKLSLITVPFVTSYRETLVSTPYPDDYVVERLQGKQRSSDLIKRALLVLGIILRDAQVRGKVVQNAVHELSVHNKARNKAARRHKHILRVGVDIPRPDEFALIMWHASGNHGLPLTTKGLTGLRSSELRGLTWSAVDLERCTLEVWQRVDRYGVIGPPKSEASYRTIPLPPQLAGELVEWKKICPESEFDLVFPSRSGRVLIHQNLARSFRRAQVLAGVVIGDKKKDEHGRPLVEAKYSGLHSLRHFFASWCINRVQDGGMELPAKMVQVLMGHATIGQTMDTYGHLFPSTDDYSRLKAAESRLRLAPKRRLSSGADGTQEQPPLHPDATKLQQGDGGDNPAGDLSP